MRKEVVFFDKADAHEGFVSSCGCKILIVKEEDSWGVYYKIAGYSYEYAYGLTLETPYPEVCTLAVKNAGYYCEVLFSE